MEPALTNYLWVNLCRQWFAFTVLSLFLFGCSSTTLAYKDTLELAFSQPEDVALTLTEILNRPYYGLYVRKDDKARTMVTLAEINKNQQKWISADSALLVLTNGRITKALGFDKQLIGQVELQQDWISKPLTKLHLADKSHLVSDWRSIPYQGISSRIEIVGLQSDTLEYFGRKIPAIKVDELVQFDSGDSVTNVYWFSAKNGLLLKSRQQPLPDWSVFEFEHISDIAFNLPIIGVE